MFCSHTLRFKQAQLRHTSLCEMYDVYMLSRIWYKWNVVKLASTDPRRMKMYRNSANCKMKILVNGAKHIRCQQLHVEGLLHHMSGYLAIHTTFCISSIEHDLTLQNFSDEQGGVVLWISTSPLLDWLTIPAINWYPCASCKHKATTKLGGCATLAHNAWHSPGNYMKFWG